MANVSPLSPFPAVAFSVSLPAATVVEATTAPFNNTREILIYNPDTTANVFVQFANVNAGLPAAGAVLSTNSTIVPPASAVVLEIGSEGFRNAMGTVAFWAANPGGSGIQLIFKSSGAIGPYSVNVTYVQNAGGGGLV